MDRDVLRTFAFAGLVYVVGRWIPLSGLQSETEPAWSEAAETTRWSILLLGFGPFFTVLVSLETLRLLSSLVFRRMRDRRHALPAPRLVILVLALLISLQSATQSYDGFVFTGLAAGDGVSRLLVVATLVAGTMTLWCLAERIELPGVALGGFWLVVSIFGLGSLGDWFTHLIERVGAGGIDVGTAAFLCALVGAAIAAAGFSALALRRDVEASGGDPRRWSLLLLWPPIIAEGLANVLARSASLRWPDPAASLPSFSAMAWVVGFCLVLPLVMMLYVRTIMNISPMGTVSKSRRARLVRLGLVQIAIGCVFQLLPDVTTSYPLQGTTLIVIAVVIASALRTDGSASRLRWALHR